MAGSKRTPEDRFWAKVQKTDGCWLWSGKLERDGYARFMVNYRRERVHRVSWMLAHGAIPDGLLVCHSCDVRNCVRPDHLFLGTYEDNQRDASVKRRLWQQQKTHCKHGHELTPDNVRLDRWTLKSTGKEYAKRQCRVCSRLKQLTR